MLLVPSVAFAADQPNAPATGAEGVGYEAMSVVRASALKTSIAEGVFSYDQTTITPNSVIAKMFNKASVALCGASSELTVTNAMEWSVNVKGDVSNAYTATLGELQEENEKTALMGCTCASNTPDGAASITAEVTGIPLATIIGRALPDADADAVRLVSADGYAVTMPLDYIMARNSVISYNINGEDLSESVGGTNQLWIDGAAAKFFARNIETIEVFASDEEVSVPGEETPGDGEYVNRPNVGVLAAS